MKHNCFVKRFRISQKGKYNEIQQKPRVVYQIDRIIHSKIVIQFRARNSQINGRVRADETRARNMREERHAKEKELIGGTKKKKNNNFLFVAQRLFEDVGCYFEKTNPIVSETL